MIVIFVLSCGWCSINNKTSAKPRLSSLVWLDVPASKHRNSFDWHGDCWFFFTSKIKVRWILQRSDEQFSKKRRFSLWDEPNQKSNEIFHSKSQRVSKFPTAEKNWVRWLCLFIFRNKRIDNMSIISSSGLRKKLFSCRIVTKSSIINKSFSRQGSENKYLQHVVDEKISLDFWHRWNVLSTWLEKNNLFSFFADYITKLNVQTANSVLSQTRHQTAV